MIIVMKENASLQELSGVIRELESRGLRPRPSHGTSRTVVGVMEAGAAQLEGVAALPGVEQVSTMSSSFKMVSRDFRAEPTVINLGGAQVGGSNFVVMAGPCAVESTAQLLACARHVRACGGSALRGGAFKPRTSPYSFQGLGEEGLKILAAAREETGLPVVTEVVSPDAVPLVARYADVLQIGARNMQNYALLEAVGRERKPVLLKRGLMSTIEELLLAAEYLHVQRQPPGDAVRARHPHLRTRHAQHAGPFGGAGDQAAEPPAGDRRSRATASGTPPTWSRCAARRLPPAPTASSWRCIRIPARAVSDGQQSLDFEAFARMMDAVRPVAAAVGRPLPEPGRP